MRTKRGRGRVRASGLCLALVGGIATVTLSPAATSPAEAVVRPAETRTTSLEATFQTRDQNLWAPGEAPPARTQSIKLFDEDWSESAGGSDGIDLGPAGSLGGSGHISTSGQVGMSLDLEGMDGGKVGVDYPVKVDVTTPAPKSFGAGDTVEISTTAAAVQAGARITTVEPDVSGVTLNGILRAAADYGFEVCIFDCFGANGTLINVPRIAGKIFGVTAEQIRNRAPAGSPEGTYCFGSIEKSALGTTPAVGGTRCPGGVGYVARPKPSVTTRNNPDGSLSASGSDTFAVIPISGMTWAQRLAGESLPLNKSIDVLGMELSWTTFDVALTTRASRTEELSFDPKVDVTLALPRAMSFRVVDPSGSEVSRGTGSAVTLRSGNKVLLDIPTDQTAPFSVTPTLSLGRHDLSNKVTHTISFAGDMTVMSARAELPDVKVAGIGFDGPGFNVGPAYRDSFSAPDTTITAVPRSTWALGGFNAPILAPVSLVPAPPPVVTPVTVRPVEGAPTDLTVATFTDEVTKAVPADYVATVSWGDGKPDSLATITGSSGSYAISAKHTYEQYGTYPVSVDLRTVPEGQLATNHVVTASTAVVSDAALTGTGLTNNTTASGQKVLTWSNPSPAAPGDAVASFADANPFGLLSDLSATIDWGDGTPVSTGTVAGPVGGPFVVSGRHDYTELGLHTVTVTMRSKGGSVARTTTTTLSYTNPQRGTFLLGRGHATGAVNFWGPQWVKTNGLAGAASTSSSLKGFANQTPPACGSAWRSLPAPGATSAPPSTVPTYMAVAVTSSVTTAGTTATGPTDAVVIVRTDPGYGPNVSQSGTGTVVAVLCGRVG